MSGAGMALCAASPALADGATNVALGKPASATGTYSIYVPSRGNDNDQTTIWNGGSHEACWQVDLEANYAIDQIVVSSNQFGGATVFQVSHSLDGSAWTPVGSTHTGSGDQSFTIDAGGADMRMIRYCTLAGSNQWATLSELQAFGTLHSVNTPPIITGPSLVAGAPDSMFAVEENVTAVGTYTANEAVTWSIDGGADAARFAINAQTGALSFIVPPDFESPGDTGADNTYIVRVKGVDADGASASQILTVTVSDVDEQPVNLPPVITGPGGVAGAAASAMNLGENIGEVTTFAANEVVTWSIDGGADAARFAINTQTGALSFNAPPDFEYPVDSDANNTYVVRVKAADAGGASATQVLTVTIANVPEQPVNVPPVITGPGGVAGAETSSLLLGENKTAVATFTASEAVTWSIDGAADATRFAIDAQTGALSFKAAPDFENPADTGGNNTYEVRVRAADADGAWAVQTLTVTVTNDDEIAAKRAELDPLIRTSLRTYAVHGLSDMLSFNESQVRKADDRCLGGKGITGSVVPNGSGANADLAWTGDIGGCGKASRLIGDLGFTRSKLGGDYNTRMFAALRFETKVARDLSLGVGVMASRADDALLGFADSAIDDKSLQFKVYARYRLAANLRTAAFAGLGRTWYDFSLRDVSGFAMQGRMNGKRQFYGWMLSGDIDLGATVLTTDAIISRAVERLGKARADIQYLGETRSGATLALGSVDVTRISVPVTAPFMISGSEGSGAWSQLLLSPGLLCEDNDVASSSLRCGYQLGARLVAEDGGRGRFHLEYRWESVSGMRRSLVGAGYVLRLGPDGRMQVSFDANRAMSGFGGADNRALLSLMVRR